MDNYEPDGDRVLWTEEYCNGYPCPVDCYKCPIAEKIYEEVENEDSLHNTDIQTDRS